MKPTTYDRAKPYALTLARLNAGEDVSDMYGGGPLTRSPDARPDPSHDQIRRSH